MRVIVVILWCSALAVRVGAESAQPGEARRLLDVLSVVFRSDNMRFIVEHPKGHAANGTVLYAHTVVRDDRREDLRVASQKLAAGRVVPQGARTIGLGNPMAEFYVGENQVLRIDLLRDRVICTMKDSSVDLLLGERGVRELQDLFERFSRANQPAAIAETH